MKVWAIADLHLAISVPEKKMDIFGSGWTNYMERIESNWRSVICSDDLILLPGDITWAMKLEQAIVDLEWIDQLPGTKVMIRGNHDYWWSSASKVRAALPASIHIIQNDAFEWHEMSIGGARLWDTQEYQFSKADPIPNEESEKIYERELGRLELSLKAMKHKKRLVMTHYPPIGPDLKPSRASKLLEHYGVSHCVFGHLHAITKNDKQWGNKNGIDYHLVAGDYLDFKPYCII